MTVLDSLSSRQKAELLLEPNNLSNETLVRLAFTELSVEDLGSFFENFVSGAAEVSNLITFHSLFKRTQKPLNLCNLFSSKT